MKMIAKIKIVVLAALFGVAGPAMADDVDCFSRGVAYTILNDGSGKFPIVEAGEVYVSLTEDATPEWTEGSYTSAIAVNVGAATSGKVKQNFYFWARAKQGYKFIGWNTSKTGKTAAAGSTTEGAPYLKTYTHWSAGSESAPKEQVMYAIFEKLVDADSEPVDKGDGVAFSAVENNEYIIGSTSKNYNVKVVFSEGLQFIDKSKASEGYGVNNALLPYVTCKGENDSLYKVVSVKINAAYADDTYTTYSDAYGLIELPNALPVGNYMVHLPYGLFNTKAGGVTGSCNFSVVIKNDDTPLTLVSHFPTKGYAWNADPENENTDGESIVVTLNYDKMITHVNEDKEITLQSATGRTYKPVSFGISRLNASQGVISFPKLPNGTYTYCMSPNVFVGANGLGNDTLSFSFSVNGSKTDEWALPTYNEISATPSDGSVVRSLTQIRINLGREGYDEPVGIIVSNGNVKAEKVFYVYPTDKDPEDPEYMPVEQRESITGLSASVQKGVLIVDFETPYIDSALVEITVPAGIVNNLAMPIATMSKQEIYEAGGCTNPEIKLSYDVCPTTIPVKDVTGIGVFDHWEKDEQGRDVRYDSYTSLIDAKLVPPVNNGDGGDRITYIYFWYPEEFTELNYKEGASITNITTQTPYNIAAIEFKTGGDVYRKNVIQMRLSTENYIHSDVYDQGEYEVVLPGGIAHTADGMVNEGITFRFTYGDTGKAYRPEAIDLDIYLGNYRNVSEEGEVVEAPETFKLEKVEDKYYVTELCGSSLAIPVEANKGGFVLKFTENNDGAAFMSYSGGDVVANFAQQQGKPYIFIDQYALYFADGNNVVGGAIYYEQYDPNAIETLKHAGENVVLYNLSGQRSGGLKGYRFGKDMKIFVK